MFVHSYHLTENDVPYALAARESAPTYARGDDLVAYEAPPKSRPAQELYGAHGSYVSPSDAYAPAPTFMDQHGNVQPKRASAVSYDYEDPGMGSAFDDYLSKIGGKFAEGGEEFGFDEHMV